MQQVFLMFAKIHKPIWRFTIHHVYFLQQYLNQEEVFDLGFQNEAKIQIWDFFSFKFYLFFLCADMEFVNIK